jgi:hypothetical protein
MNDAPLKKYPPIPEERLPGNHTELINERETWRDIRGRIFHLLGQGYAVKIRADTSELLVYDG